MSGLGPTPAAAIPDDIKVLFLAAPVLGDTEAEARDKFETHDLVARLHQAGARALTARSRTSISRAIDLDSPLPKLTTNGEQGSLDKFQQWGSGKTLAPARSRWRYVEFGRARSGRPIRLPARMGEVMEAVGGDGFPDQGALPSAEPPLYRRGHGRSGARPAAPRPDADGLRPHAAARHAEGILTRAVRPPRGA